MLTSVREAVQAGIPYMAEMRWFYVSASGDGRHGRTQLANAGVIPANPGVRPGLPDSVILPWKTERVSGRMWEESGP